MNRRIIIRNRGFFFLTRFDFTEDRLMLRLSLIAIERNWDCEAAMSKAEKGEVENGIHSTVSPCWCRRDVVNGTVSVDNKDEELNGAAERTAMWNPR